MTPEEREREKRGGKSLVVESQSVPMKHVGVRKKTFEKVEKTSKEREGGLEENGPVEKEGKSKRKKEKLPFSASLSSIPFTEKEIAEHRV